METHPPHVHHSSGKKFSHYFYEFLMLFLAVFCGFLAENIREEKVEHFREKEFMKSMAEDLKTDTSNLKVAILLGEFVSVHLDSLIKLLNKYPDKIMDEDIYKMYSKSSRVVGMDFEDRTSSQLKNAGNMRLIRNSNVADSIRNYWSLIKTLESISARLEDSRSKQQDFGSQLFHNKYFLNANMKDPVHSITAVLPGAKLINQSTELIAQYSNRRYWNLIVLNNYIYHMKETIEKANSLIKLVEKEYLLNKE